MRRRDAAGAWLIAWPCSGRSPARSAPTSVATAYSVFKLSLLSVTYFLFPLGLGISAFKTWTEFLIVATAVLGLAMVPVIVCFWPERRTARPSD